MGERLHNGDKQPESGWGKSFGKFMRFDDVKEYFGEENSKDLIILPTKEGTMVCPCKQFRCSITEGGKDVYEIIPEVALLWKVVRLSGLSEWACAGTILTPPLNEKIAVIDIVTDPETPEAERRGAVWCFIKEEFYRARWIGTVEEFKEGLRRIAEDYGAVFVDENQIGKDERRILEG